MKKELKILILEDNPSDAELIKLELKKTNKEFESRVVQDEENFLKELETFQPDLILSDYSMPQFTGLDALEIAKKKCPEIPFIIVTGSVNEETAIKCMRWGAWDYVLKDKLVHLGHAVTNALRLKAENEKKKLTEEALRKSEEQFRLITENTSDVISLHTFDLKATYTYVSPSIKAMSGYEPEELLGKSGFDFIHPEDKKKLFLLLKKYLNLKIKKLLTGKESKISETIEFRFKDKTGNWRFMHSTINIVGKKLLSVARDITERKQAVEAIRESEEIFRAVFYTAQDSIFIKDTSLRYRKVNTAMEELFGVGSENLINKTDIDLSGEEAGNLVMQSDKQVLKGEIIEEFPTKPVGGVMHSFHTIKVPLKDPDGKITGICGIARDITERKQAEELLKKSEDKYRLLADNSMDAIWQTDLKLVFTYISPSVKNIMGYTVDEWVGTRLSQHARTKEIFNIEKKALYAIKHYKEFKDLTFEMVMLHKDGTEIPVEITTKLIFGKNGLPVGLQGTTRDITERKQAEKDLEKRMKELEIFNDAAVDREIMLNEARKEINDLLEKLGKEPKYEIVK